MDYQVDLETFRGPLDLLLYLVKRQEVDICDIPIARVTEQFLEYLRLLEMIDVERAGDFLVMAATLMEIKSRMLLPREEMAGEDAADPRQELVRQLLEYKKFKDAAALLEAQAERQLTRFSRLRVDPPMNIDPAVQPLHAVELWDLVSAFGRLMRETLALQPQQVVVDETPVQIYQDRILQMLEKQPRLAFADIFTPPRTRPRLVGLFLALLELIRTNQIFAHQEQGFGEIWLRLSEDEVQKSEDREQRSEVRGQKSEDRSQSTDDV
jgi:segregation and condensation protein A